MRRATSIAAMKTTGKKKIGSKTDPTRLSPATNAAGPAPALELSPLRFQIKKILAPTDFSEPSRKALRYARVFAEQFGATLVVLHVIEPIVYPADFGYLPVDAPVVEAERIENIQKELERVTAEIGHGITTKTAVRSGRPWKEITDFAAAEGADLVVVSTHGYTGLEHALLGSVAEKIVRHAHCPVLVVREHERDFA